MQKTLRWSVMRLAVRLALTLAAPPGCRVLSHSCTAIGCADGVELSVRTANGSWAAGSYTIELTTEGGPSHVCSGVLPEVTAGDPGAVVALDCVPALGSVPMALFEPMSVCTERRTTNAVTSSCTPVPGQLTLNLSLEGTPRSLQLRVALDGVSLLDRSIAPSYKTFQPNGGDCEPTCRVAQTELSLP